MTKKYQRKYSDKYHNRSRELNWAKFQIKGMLANIAKLNTMLLLSDNRNMATGRSTAHMQGSVLIKELQRNLKSLSSIVEDMRRIERHLDAHRNKEEDNA